MDPTDLSDAQLDQLAQRLAPHLPTGTHGDRVVLSRRAFAAASAGVLSTGALMALGVDEASAQAAGQQGTASSPNDMFAYNLDVQNGATFNGTDIKGVGSLSTDEILGDLSTDPQNPTVYLQRTTPTLDIYYGGVSTSIVADNTQQLIISGAIGARSQLTIHAIDSADSVRFTDVVATVPGGANKIGGVDSGSPGTRAYSEGAGDILLSVDGDGSTFDLVVLAAAGVP